MRLRSLISPIAALQAVVISAISVVSVSGQTPRRPLQVADLDAYRDLGDLALAPDGAWVAYAVKFADPKRDKDDSDVWMTNWAGTEHVRLTASPERESQPRFSPDGKWLAFLSSRTTGSDDKTSGGQVWLLNRQGGEARRLTDRKGGVSDFQWSPDATRLVLVGDDPDPEEDKADDDKTPKKPIVIDRYGFKQDAGGYLDHRRSHLYLLTIATGAIETLTSGDFDDQLPAWSPEGARLAFTSGRGGDRDKTNDSNLFVVEAKAGAEPRALTTWNGPDDQARPAWSPDGASIAYLQGSEPKLFAYSRNTLAVVAAAGGSAPRLLTDPAVIDVDSPAWTPDGKALYVLTTNDRTRELARVAVAGGPLVRLTSGRRVVKAAVVGKDGRIAVIATTGITAPEVQALAAPAAGKPEGPRALKVLSTQNDAWLAGIQLGAVEDADVTSPDGTKVGALVVKPPTYTAGTRYPLILYIHGGPNGQDQHELDLESQILAAKGYVVLNVNYRGSAGRDAAFQTAIYADWGNKEVVDLRAAVDHLIATGVADPARLGIGGWSYGGILTDYTIATDPRFKAAVSGAGSALQSSMYGTDQYVFQYNLEMGPPWKNPEVWTKVSYPFLHADRIKTPTLFLCSQADFNVPCAGAEQMYQALRTEGVETQLVIYPGQHHGLTVPSYRRDRLQRYADWFGKYLGGSR
jgi:dipeptidyl aminopeptidase/acylaminoacyl peptidase